MSTIDDIQKIISRMESDAKWYEERMSMYDEGSTEWTFSNGYIDSITAYRWMLVKLWADMEAEQ